MNENLYESVIEQLIEQDYAVCQNLVSPRVLSGLRNNLIRKIKEEKLRKAGIGRGTQFGVHQEIRSDEILWLSQDSTLKKEQAFLKHVSKFSAYLNQTCFTGIQKNEFHYAHFKKGSFFKRHLDCFQNDISRKYSMVFYLNKQWVDGNGGELVLYGKKPIEIEPVFGNIVIFNSRLLEHEVLPTKKSRYTITGWLK